MTDPSPWPTPEETRRPGAARGPGGFAYLVAWLSFLPGLGVVFGGIGIVWGATRNALSLILIGVGGIAFNVALILVVIYFGLLQRGGTFDRLREELAAQMLVQVVDEIEAYHEERGRYPQQIADLAPPGRRPDPTVDPTFMQRGLASDPHFFYELLPDEAHYFLRSVGTDGVPFTADDILPPLTEERRSHTGLLLHR